MVVRNAVACVLATFALCAPAGASPWGRDAGDVFLSTKSSYFVATAPPIDATIADRVRFERIDADIYAEWGVGWGLTVGGKVLYGTSSYSDGFAASSASGVSEYEAFLQKRIVGSARDALSIRFATARSARLDTGARPGFAAEGFDAEFRALYGRDLVARPVKIFATAETGYRRRFGPSSDQLRGDVLLGLERGRGLLLMEAQTTKSIGSAETGGARYDVVRLQATAVWRLNRRVSLQFGGAHEAAGRGALLGDSVFAGFWTRF